MDPHQAAYWLSKSPDEAADFLAKTAVASQRIGGFVKRGAVSSPGWQDALNQLGSNPHVQNALIGAGVGGLGGLGVGMLSGRKKNPLSAALTGAALGGLGAGAGSYLYHNPPTGLFGTSPEASNAAATQDNMQAKARQNASSIQKLMADITGKPVEPAAPPTPVSAPSDPLAAVKSQESTAGNLYGALTGDHPFAAPAEHIGLGYLQGQHANRIGAMNKLDAYMGNTESDPSSRRNLTGMIEPTFNDMQANQAAGRNRAGGLGSWMPNLERANAGQAVLNRWQGQSAGKTYAGLNSISPTDAHFALTQGGNNLPARGIGGKALNALKYTLPHLGLLGYNHLTNTQGYGGEQ